MSSLLPGNPWTQLITPNTWLVLTRVQRLQQIQPVEYDKNHTLKKVNGKLTKTNSLNCFPVFNQGWCTLIWPMRHLLEERGTTGSFCAGALPGHRSWSPCAWCGKGAPGNHCWGAHPGAWSSSHRSAWRPAVCQPCTLQAAWWPKEGRSAIMRSWRHFYSIKLQQRLEKLMHFVPHPLKKKKSNSNH